MKYLRTRYLSIFLFFAIVAIFIFAGNQTATKTKIIHYKIDGMFYRLLIADEPAEWERGLMNVRKLDQASGMIFIFPNKEYRNFWNKNTLVDLDVYWISDDKIVGKSFLPSIEKSRQIVTVSSPQAVNKVVELIHVL